MKRKNCKEDYEDDTENECFTDPSENVVSEQSSRSLDLANDDCSSNSVVQTHKVSCPYSRLRE